jgi:hypothetical protein
MSDDLQMEIEGLAEAQAALRQATAAVSAQGGLAGAIAKGTLRAQRYAVGIVHVLTGRLKNSLHTRMVGQGSNQVYGLLYSNVVYAAREDALGGSHAYMARTQREEGPAILSGIRNDLYGRLP